MTEKEQTVDNSETATLEKKPLTRDELMRMSSQLIRILHRRTTAHRFKPSQHDSPRLQYARATIAAITAYGGLLKDVEITELEERLTALEKWR